MAYLSGRAPKHGRRSKLDIVGDILRVVSHGAEKPTNVMFRANLTWPLTVAYIELLLRHRMLSTEEGGGRAVYRVTPKGSELLRSFIEMEEGTAELELDRFDASMFSKVMSRPAPPESPGVPAPLREAQKSLERHGYREAQHTLLGHSGVDHAFDLVMTDPAGTKVGYVVTEKAEVGDVIRAFILQTDCELQVRILSASQPSAEAGELAKTYGILLQSGAGAVG